MSAEPERVRQPDRAGVADAVARLPVKAALIDAEVVVQTEAGVASFTALVDALKTGNGTLILYAFDLLHLDGQSLLAVPLEERKRLTRARLIAFTKLTQEQRQLITAARQKAFEVDRGVMEADQKLVDELLPTLDASVRSAYPQR
mgnify:CR=1 FL=1